VTIRSIANSLVVASSIGTGLMQGVVLFLATQGAHLNGYLQLWPRLVWPRLVVAQPEAGRNSHSSSVPGRSSQAGALNHHQSQAGTLTYSSSPRPELSFISPRPSFPGRNSQNSSVPRPSLPGGTLNQSSQAVISPADARNLLAWIMWVLKIALGVYVISMY
jgi:hypothetical protein